MDDTPQNAPTVLPVLRAAALDAGFVMSCDERTGSLLAVLAATRPGGRTVELGTGVGEGTAWLLSGMDSTSQLVSVELDRAVAAVASEQLGDDPRLKLVTGDGGKWLEAYAGPRFDLVFADTRPGKVYAPGAGPESRCLGWHLSDRRSLSTGRLAGGSRGLGQAPVRRARGA